MDRINDGIIFSNDIYYILNGKNSLGFSYVDNNIIIPKKEEIDLLRKDFLEKTSRYFEKVSIVEEKDMVKYLNFSLKTFKDYPIISLDKIYLDNNKYIYLDCTRLSGSDELVSRLNPNDHNSVDNQIKYISDSLKRQKYTDIILADDVVFTASVLRTLVEKFKKEGINVIGIGSAISSMSGFEYFNETLKNGLRCGLLMGDNVIDQVCERDFYFGIAQAGISEKILGTVYKRPYFEPFGNPVERASVPKKFAKDFSINCIDRNIELWDNINANSARKIKICELPERIYGLDDDEETVVNALRRVR